MDYLSGFCNVCLNKDTDGYLNICKEEHKHILEILLCLLDSADFIQNADIYLCPSCCEQLLSYKEFREMCVENLVNLRELHAKWKFKLESETDVSTEKELAFFTANTVFEGPNSDCIGELKIGDDSAHDHVDPLMIKKEEDVEPAEVLAAEALEDSDVEEQMGVLPADHWETKLHEEEDLDNSGDELEDLDWQDGHLFADSAHDTPAELSSNWTDDSLTKDNCSQGGSAGAAEKQQRKKRSARQLNKRTHGRSKSYKCEVCARVFTDKSNFRRHKRVHTGEKPYKCEVCARAFSQMCTLTKHKRVHTGEKPYKCEVCRRVFAQKAHLTKHQLLHTGERSFQCEVCAISFMQKFALLRHQRLHTGERSFECEVCANSFKKKFALLRHQRLHTGERPFKCEVCAKSFMQKFGLLRHQRLHTDEKLHKCEVCARTFTNNSSLQAHKCEVCAHSFKQDMSCCDISACTSASCVRAPSPTSPIWLGTRTCAPVNLRTYSRCARTRSTGSLPS